MKNDHLILNLLIKSKKNKNINNDLKEEQSWVSYTSRYHNLELQSLSHFGIDTRIEKLPN